MTDQDQNLEAQDSKPKKETPETVKATSSMEEVNQESQEKVEVDATAEQANVAALPVEAVAEQVEEAIETNFKTRINLEPFSKKVEAIRSEIANYIVGQEQMVNLLIIALLADGHVLIEGVPGVAKTITARILSRTIDADFKRIQFTPDLLPSDIIGTSIFNAQSSKFTFNKGPLFSNIILADEINRAPAKTQAALFEAMEERQITADGTTYKLDPPFVVLATQNPVDQEGTYRLPEAQIDRFLFKILVDYPTLDQEVKIITDFHERKRNINVDDVKTIINRKELKELRDLIGDIFVEEKLIRYIAQIVESTRNNPNLFLGASPRASLAILHASKALAAMQGRDFVSPDDIKFVVPHILVHRLILSPEKEIEGIESMEYIQELLNETEIPR
jgi:MoxR-like ATPase